MCVYVHVCVRVCVVCVCVCVCVCMCVCVRACVCVQVLLLPLLYTVQQRGCGKGEKGNQTCWMVPMLIKSQHTLQALRSIRGRFKG